MVPRSPPIGCCFHYTTAGRWQIGGPFYARSRLSPSLPTYIISRLTTYALASLKSSHLFSGLFYPLDSTEAVYPAENASAVYQTLDVMGSFWQEASTAHEHMLTT